MRATRFNQTNYGKAESPDFVFESLETGQAAPLTPNRLQVDDYHQRRRRLNETTFKGPLPFSPSWVTRTTKSRTPVKRLGAKNGFYLRDNSSVNRKSQTGVGEEFKSRRADQRIMRVTTTTTTTTTTRDVTYLVDDEPEGLVTGEVASRQPRSPSPFVREYSRVRRASPSPVLVHGSGQRHYARGATFPPKFGGFHQRRF